MVVFGHHVRELRLKTGMSQEKFALLIGMDRTYFASVENGKRNISDGLNVSMSELFCDL